MCKGKVFLKIGLRGETVWNVVNVVNVVNVINVINVINVGLFLKHLNNSQYSGSK